MDGALTIEQLAEHGDFLETCYLLLRGELPSRAELEGFSAELKRGAEPQS